MAFNLQTFTLFTLVVLAAVLVVQLFRRVPDLETLAPPQSEPPFAMAQLLVLASFIWLAVAANAGIRSTVAR